MAIVFIDELRPTPIDKVWTYKEASRIWSESEEELDRMASRLGLRSFRKHDGYYRVTKNMRKRAVRLGCVEVSAKELDTKMKGVLVE